MIKYKSAPNRIKKIPLRRKLFNLIIKLKIFSTKWLLPPKISDFIEFLLLNYFSQYKIPSQWSKHPIITGIIKNNFKNFKNTLWLTLDNESRPGIILDKGTNIIKNINLKGNKIQIGFGKSDNHKKNISIFINETLVGQILEIEKNKWSDLFLRIINYKKINEIKVIIEGKGEIFFSFKNHNSLNINIKSTEKIKNIVCIIVDGLNHENFNEKTTPYTKSFFQNGVNCKQVFSQADWTLPAFSSMLTSYYPSSHGVYNSGACEFSLPKNLVTLPEILNKYGYNTFAFSDHSKFTPAFGHGKGFDRFLFKPKNPFLETIKHLEAHGKENNFIFLHIFDTHSPFKPAGYYQNLLTSSFRHGSYNSQLNENNEWYKYRIDERRARLIEVDLNLNILYSYLLKKPWIDNSYVVLTADHGIPDLESNKQRLSYQRTNIPLFVKGDKLNLGYENCLIEGNVDLMPSLLELANIEKPENIHGKSWPFLNGEKREFVYTEAHYFSNFWSVLRDESYSYHYKCPFDYQKRIHYYEKKEDLVIFARKNGVDLEDNNCFSEIDDVEKILKIFDSKIQQKFL